MQSVSSTYKNNSNLMSRFLDGLVSQFGFKDHIDFSGSMFHFNLMMVTIPFAALSSIIENMFGLHIMTIAAFVLLLALELTTGLVASKKRGLKIESRKFGRFGFKLVIWLTLFFIINSLKKQYDGNSTVVYGLYEWLHDGLMIYVSLEYLISVLENLGHITGENNKGFIYAIKKKIGMTDPNYTDFFEKHVDLLCVIGKDGFFKKVNSEWATALGWSEEELLMMPFASFLHQDDYEKTVKEFDKLKDPAYAILNFVSRYRTKGGDYADLSWSARLSPNGDIYATARVLDK